MLSLQFEMTDGISPNLKALAKLFPEDARKSSGVAALAVIQDALTVNPTPPIDTGYLRSSWFVSAGGKMVRAGADNTMQPPEGDPLGAVYGFSAPYAAAQHENLVGLGSGSPSAPIGQGEKRDKWYPSLKSQQSGAGGKFLESKMLNAPKYGLIWSKDFKVRLEALVRKLL